MTAFKALARRLDVYFGAFLEGYPDDCAFGYRPNRNIRENAAVHCGHTHLLSVDIKDFFPSISRTRIHGLFELLHIKTEIADALANFVTIDGALPLGVPTSPAISNAIAVPIDQMLSALATKTDASYSRYSDDISFSGNGALPELEEVRAVLADCGFSLADGKTSRSVRGQSHYVTGLSISDVAQPHVPRAKKRRLRQELYYARKFGLREHLCRIGIADSTLVQAEVNRIDGLVKFVAYHEPKQGARLRESWKTVLLESGLRPSFMSRKQSQPPCYFFIDETELERGDQRYLALCMVATQNPESVADATQQVRVKLINDLWSDGNVQSLIDRGLHFAENTEDQRLAYVTRLAGQPIQAYVACSDMSDPCDYEALYLKILAKMLSRRLIASESKFAVFCFEKNQKVSQRAISECVNSAHTRLQATNSRRPLVVSTDFVSKPHFGASAADYFLGLLAKYFHSRPARADQPEPRDRLMFDRLRDRYRVIADLSTGIECTRRNPIRPWQDDESP